MDNNDSKKQGLVVDVVMESKNNELSLENIVETQKEMSVEQIKKAEKKLEKIIEEEMENIPNMEIIIDENDCGYDCEKCCCCVCDCCNGCCCDNCCCEDDCCYPKMKQD